MNLERIQILGSLNRATIDYKNIGSDGSLYLLNEMANIADQVFGDYDTKDTMLQFFDMLRDDYLPEHAKGDLSNVTVAVDLVNLAKHLNATVSQTKEWLWECNKVELVIETPLHKVTMPMIITTDIAETDGGKECQARIIIKALLLFLYRCPYNNSYALDFLKEL